MSVPADPSREVLDAKDSSSKCVDAESSRDVTSRTPAVWAKLDLFVLPVVTMVYFLSSLDRSNIGNARIAGLQKQLRMSDDQYTIALTVTLITYSLTDLPSNLAVKAVGPRWMIPTMVVLWGLACTLQGVVHSYAGLIVCRLFLGLFEGGILPAISLYLSSFYPRRQLQFRIAIMFSATSLASAFSGLLAAAILHMDGVGGRPGWAWVFILEGLFTVMFGAFAYSVLPNTPTAATFLSSDEKRDIVQALREDGIIDGAEQDESYTPRNMLITFTQPHVIMIMLIGFMSGSTLSGLAYFLPSIVAGLGYSGTKAQLMSVPPFAVSAFLSVVTAFIADRSGQRGLNIIFFATMAMVGFAIFYASFVDHVRYGSLFLLVPGTYCIGPPLGTWAANNSAPLIRRATVLALLPMMTNVGSILSTWLLGAISPAPRYTSATITLLSFQIGIILCAALNIAWLMRENKRKARGRANAVGAAQSDGDRSVVGKADDSVWFEYVM